MMTTITGIMEWVLENIAGFAIVIFEFIGVAIIIWVELPDLSSG